MLCTYYFEDLFNTFANHYIYRQATLKNFDTNGELL